MLAKVDTTFKATRLSVELKDVGKSNHPRSYTDATLIASRTVNLGAIESAKFDVKVNANDSFGLYCKADTKLSFAIPIDALQGAKAYVGATTGGNISDKKADKSTIYMGVDYTNPMGAQIKVRYRTPNTIGDNYGQEDNLISFSRQWFF